MYAVDYHKRAIKVGYGKLVQQTQQGSLNFLNCSGPDTESDDSAMTAQGVNPPVREILVEGYNEPFFSLSEFKNRVVARIGHIYFLHMVHNQSQAKLFEP